MKKVLILYLLVLSLAAASETEDISLSYFAQQVSLQNNINIYIDEDIQDKTVSLYVPDQISNDDILELFKSTVTKLDFNLLKIGSTYYLKKKLDTPDTVYNYIFNLVYNSSNDCKSILDILKVPYTFLPESNSFIISTTEKQYLEAETFLKKVDSIQKQVILKIIILEFQDDDTKEAGFKYASIYKGITGATEYALNTIVAPLNTNNLTLSNIDFYGALRLLNEDKKINVKQFPYILAKNNQTFKFEAVDNIPYLVNSTTTQATNTSQQTSIEYKDVGLKINGKSFIYDDYITLDLDLVIEDLVNQDKTETPQVYKRHLVSNTNIEFDKVLLLSGIKRDKHETTNINLPVLSKIPYLGEAFKYSYNTDKQLNITISIEVLKSNDSLLSAKP
ncbi:MAG: hypothetical protein RBT59_09915 [Arcobacteraceae bacterium]|jgi:general secretion pathway protein D|nr:hypothetical protein [Arcobacteraceae bacterium]